MFIHGLLLLFQLCSPPFVLLRSDVGILKSDDSFLFPSSLGRRRKKWKNFSSDAAEAKKSFFESFFELGKYSETF